jgi:hypothetical protein
MAWVCPSCGFKENHDSSIRCLCGHEISPDEERNYSKTEGVLDAESESGSHSTWEYFIAGFFISFFAGFAYLLFDFFDSSRFSWTGLLIVFMICLFIGFVASLYGHKFIRFLLELIIRS